jgi:hypothetical protein
MSGLVLSIRDGATCSFVLAKIVLVTKPFDLPYPVAKYFLPKGKEPD